MKRALVLILIIAVCIAGFMSVRGTMPFMAVFGTSMEPTLKGGSLILIEEVSPSEVKVGDIIVFIIPPMVREVYNYPLVVAHRVTTVITEPVLVFRTKGDNTGEDPFTVRPQDIRGRVSQQIPYLGFPLLFFQSQQGLIFIIIALCLFAIHLYDEELGQGRQKIHKRIFAPVIAESRRTSHVLEQRIAKTEKRMEDTQQALEKFAAAIEVYAEHLKSHNNAIQGLSEAAQELKHGAAEQNKVLSNLSKVVEEMSTKQKPIPTIEPMPPMIKPVSTVTEPIWEHVPVTRKASPGWGEGLNMEDWLESKIMIKGIKRESILSEEEEQLDLVDSLFRATLSYDGVSNLCQRFAAELSDLMEIDWVAIAIIDKPKDAVYLSPLSHEISSTLDLGDKILLSGTPIAWVAENKCTAAEPDLTQANRFWTDTFWLKQGIRSLVYLPLFWQREVYAVLIVGSKKPDVYQKRELKLLRYAASQFAIPLKSFQLMAEIMEEKQRQE